MFLWAVWSLPVICPGAVSCAAASSRPGNQFTMWSRFLHGFGKFIEPEISMSKKRRGLTQPLITNYIGCQTFSLIVIF